MTTVDELARDVIASNATNANAIAAAKWIDNRYKEMVSTVKFRHLRKVGELSLPAKYNTGTLAITRGSTAVVGTGTQFETDIGATTHEYYYLRTNSAWYRIASVTDETNLVLDSAYAEATVTAASYDIVKRTHPLATNARWIGEFYHTRLRVNLKKISLDGLNSIVPGRPLIQSIPQYVAEAEVDSNGYRTVEIYPPPVTNELVNYIYWTLPPTLSIGSTIPSVIDPYTLKEGVLIDLYRYEKALAIRNGNIEQAALWRNDEKAQASTWRKAIQQAAKTDRGSDDISLILQMFHGSRPDRYDQKTASDYIYDNWSR